MVGLVLSTGGENIQLSRFSDGHRAVLRGRRVGSIRGQHQPPLVSAHRDLPAQATPAGQRERERGGQKRGATRAGRYHIDPPAGHLEHRRG